MMPQAPKAGGKRDAGESGVEGSDRRPRVKPDAAGGDKESRGKTPVSVTARNVAGSLSLIPLISAGLATQVLARDKRAFSNMVLPAWMDRKLLLAGVKLRVTGRRNLWARRPAVYIFNHRNNFDGLFAVALVRTDFVGIAKKEIGESAIGRFLGHVMPTVYVDRGAGRTKAIEALAPVLEKIEDGFSVLVAPEGTSAEVAPDTMAPFKKGAFHIAMGAQIPVIPIVFRNALDVASRLDRVMRPGTVDVTVLPPISVEDWTSDNLNERMEEVRQLFIDTLRSWPGPDKAA